MYLARKRAEKLVREKFGEQGRDFYITSLSCRTICYKGMFMAWQLFAYYPDLAEKRILNPPWRLFISDTAQIRFQTGVWPSHFAA